MIFIAQIELSTQETLAFQSFTKEFHSHLLKTLSSPYDPASRATLFSTYLYVPQSGLRQFNKDVWRNKSLQALVEVGLPIAIDSELLNLVQFRIEYAALGGGGGGGGGTLEMIFEIFCWKCRGFRDWKAGRLWYCN